MAFTTCLLLVVSVLPGLSFNIAFFQPANAHEAVNNTVDNSGGLLTSNSTGDLNSSNSGQKLRRRMALPALF